jgi:transcriptional regulator with XRE-family HTH domain
MKPGAPGSFGAKLKAHREAAGFTQEELATIAGLSGHAISALERGERRRPHVDTVRALCAALDLTGASRDALVGSARAPAHNTLGAIAFRPTPHTMNAEHQLVYRTSASDFRPDRL